MDTNQKIAKANSFGEVLDLVDEQDRIVGQIERQKANSDPQFIHREVGVLLLQKDLQSNQFKVLLQKRSKHKIVSPGVWSIIAGHVSSGQVAETVVYQELEEEMGLDSIELSFFAKKLLRYEHESHFMNYYVGMYQDEKITVDPLEIEEYAFFSLSEIEGADPSRININKTHLPIIKEVLLEYEQM